MLVTKIAGVGAEGRRQGSLVGKNWPVVEGSIKIMGEDFHHTMSCQRLMESMLRIDITPMF